MDDDENTGAAAGDKKPTEQESGAGYGDNAGAQGAVAPPEAPGPA